MCDAEIHFNNSNFSGREKMLVEDQRMASLRYVAFWSNPAWFGANKHTLLTKSAIKEWVTYHRLSFVANKKETVIQNITSVKEVIPNSRLAKYGDYSYDIDYEDMYCIAEEVNSRPHILKGDKSAYIRRYDFWGSDPEIKTFDTKDKYLYPTSNKRSERSLCEWLEELQRNLVKVRQIANEAQLLDSWTETLLKYCLRFVWVLRSNENLVDLLNSEKAFIIDYEGLRKIPSSKIELQSIPQLENNGEIFFSNADDLWSKMSSPTIQKIWKEEMRFPFPFNKLNQSNKDLVPMMKTNFLRKQQSLYLSRRTEDFSIEIPKNMENELLGSLLDIINGISSHVNDSDMNCFPEAHGEWTKHLFPHRIIANSRFDNQSANWKPRDAAPSLKDSDANINFERRFSENAALPKPLQFYKSVPPPTVAARLRLPYVNYQSRNKIPFIAPNLISNPSRQQVQYKAASRPNVQSAASVLHPSFPKRYNMSQQLQTPSSYVCRQPPRFNILRALHYYHLEATKKYAEHPSMKDMKASDEKIFTKNEAKDLNKPKLECNSVETTQLSISPLSTTEPFLQLNHECNVPLRIQQNKMGNANKMPQSVVSNPELQVCDSRTPVMIYPMTSARLRARLIKMMPTPRNSYILPQFTRKTQFLGPLTINNARRIKEESFQQRQHDYTNNISYEDFEKNASSKKLSPSSFNDVHLRYEDKVEKWLESVNIFLKNGSHTNLKELPEFPSSKLPELSSKELSELYSVELSQLPNAESTELPTVELSEHFPTELPKHLLGKLSEFSSIKLPKHTRTKLPDVYSKSNNAGKGDSEESGKSQNEKSSETLEQNSSGDHIKSTLNADRDTVIGNFRESKVDILKRKKLKAKRDFFEHLQQFSDIIPKLKRCKNEKRKIKIVKNYFREINSISIGRFPFETFIKILGKRNPFIKKVGQTKIKDLSVLKQEWCLGKEFDNHLSSRSNIDIDQSNLLINDISNYNMWIRESQEFNNFPSKRVKLSASEASFLETKTLIRNEQDRWIASLNYLDSVIDELLFADDRIQKIHKGNHKTMINTDTNGWTHFAVVIKTIMENIISSLNGQISQNLCHRNLVKN